MNNKTSFNPCAVIPVYNHFQVLHHTVEYLIRHNLPVILVDDGSNETCKQVLNEIEREIPQVHLVTRRENGGKGAAIKVGLTTALAKSYSHALQVDADGQHNLEDTKRFLAAAESDPDALICGYPVYDESMPKHRFYGRYASHIWVWINTLSLEIIDSMCGFRVYPVVASCELLQHQTTGNRMDFDGEFMVRWHWQQNPLQQLPTKVIYPADGISHFRLWRDNGLISLMHARLFFGMLLRLPGLLARKGRAQQP